jgi:translation initiation factor IF-1
MKEELLKVQGTVIEVLPNATFRVKLKIFEKVVLCYLCGKMNKRFIKLTVGDNVELEMSPHDFTRGRIMRRL